MTVKDDLRSLLLADAGIGGRIADRCAWGISVQDDPTPRIVLHLISDTPDYHLLGASGFDPMRIQVNCFGASYSEADDLAEAVKAAVKAVPAPGAPYNSIRQIQIVGGRDLTEASQPDPLFLIAIDLMVS